MLHIYHSNKLKIHVEIIANLIKKKPLNNPFKKEIIVVQNLNISNWLQIELAKKLDVVANISFLLPSTFFYKMFSSILFNISEESVLNKRTMIWKVMQILPSLMYKPMFKLLKEYLKEDINKSKLYQLSCKIADVFNQYLIYRPEWLEKWYNQQLVEGLSDHQEWQKELWLALIQYSKKVSYPKFYQENFYQQFIKCLQLKRFSAVKFPQRLFIVGISMLPPIYIKILHALGEHVDIYLINVNPCRYYYDNMNWYAYIKRYQENKLYNYQNKYQVSCFLNQDLSNILYDKPLIMNPLLVAWGRLGWDYFYYLSQLDQVYEVNAFVDISGNSLLHQIQRDILDFKNYMQLGLTSETFKNSSLKRRLSKKDKSITFHSCHSIKREVEILQDYLLGLFEKDSKLRPKDIIVMVTNIDDYLPYIQAVFSYVSQDRRLPISISGKKIKGIDPIFKVFLSFLDLPKIRFTTKEVLNLLEIPAVARRFSIDEKELDCLRQWVKESGICWGVNDENVKMLKLPITGKNTWDFGLNRMSLGYAMDSNFGIWDDILPYNECTGLAAESVGKLAKFVDLLWEWRNILNQKRTLSAWLPLCKYLLDTFFYFEKNNESTFVFLLKKWHEILNIGIVAKYKNVVPISIIRDEFLMFLNDKKMNQCFFSGEINFCTFMSICSIPFKVVCLLGMNEKVYPRLIPSVGFNLIEEKPEFGDKIYRDNDFYLFLEVLNSTSQFLYLSYIGYSINDNHMYNPSIVLTELLDYISYSFCLEGDENLNVDESAKKIKQHLLIKHTRVPFAIENYFSYSENQSYSDEWLSVIKRTENHPQSIFCADFLPITKVYNEILLEELLFFYRNPIVAFFQKRLKVNFLNEVIQLPEEEPFFVNGLQKYKFNKFLLNAMINEESSEKLFFNFFASGKLPAKNFARIYWDKQITNMQPLVDKVKMHLQKSFSKLFVESFEKTDLIGELKNIQKNGVIRYRPAKLTVIDGLSLWIEHLVFCIIFNIGKSYYFGTNNSEWCFDVVNKCQAKIYLQQLINGYENGMNKPLPLLLNSGWNWLISCFDKKNDQFNFHSDVFLKKANIKLMESLEGIYNQSGEMQNIYIRRAFNKIDDNLLNEIKKNTLLYLLPMAIFLKNKKHIL
ncbi:exodeoxyribonuclease V subunit gamma [Arsenophonus symbiont of Ornithomya chloropus]|uniref:exodeoxyribonuclease V subunit gamma n=1 Tax=Arsenophonus symbiont of Ornithomya chloropus TaxID=634121 RepID=UPI0032B109EA